MKKTIALIRSLGPGLLYAGAAVGVSHLVQSTRAGASYGFELLWILVAAHIIKYPFFEFGPRYAASTGKSLIHAYSQMGRWALWAFLLLTFFTMFGISAAISMVTAGLFAVLTGIQIPIVWVAFIMMVSSMALLLIGRFAALEGIIKFIIILLSVSTIAAVGAAMHFPIAQGTPFHWGQLIDLAFVIAFVGWMPAPIDVSVWHSTWSTAKQGQTDAAEDKSTRVKRALRDFKIGYIGTGFLAIGFLSLGTFVMYGQGSSFAAGGVAFAHQLIEMYTTGLGQWAYWIIGIAALTTMLSTSFTVMDAYPRVLQPTLEHLWKSLRHKRKWQKYAYPFWMALIVLGSMTLLLWFNKSMKFMVDLATTISFVTAPILAILNYKAVNNSHCQHRPAKWLNIYAIAGIIFLSAFSLFYIIWKTTT